MFHDPLLRQDTRRELLRRSALGIGSLGLWGVLGDDG